MRNTYLDHYQYLWEDQGEHYIGQLTQLSVLQKNLADPNQAFYFSYNNEGEIAGFMKLFLDSPVPEDSRQNAACLDKIYLMANATGQGLGKQLMEKGFAQARALGRQWMWLRVMESSEEIQEFYRRAGFEITSTADLNLQYMKPEYRKIHTMVKEL